MKRVMVLLLFMSSLIAFTNCGKVKERKMEDKLTYKPWNLYKVEQNGTVVPNTNNYVAVFSFYRNGTYLIHDNLILANSASFGGWSLSGSILTLTNNDTWEIKTLTDNELILKNITIDYVAYFD